MAAEPKISSQLISHIAQFRDDPWDSPVRRRTALCLLDSLACYSAGRSLKHFGPIATVASGLFGISEISTPSAFATAYLYGAAANLLDYDDTLFFGHPGAAIIGAVLSVAARDNLSTDRLLRGIAAGYEAQWLLSAAAAPSPERGALVRSVGVWDTVAASIGISVALGLDDGMIERVLGVAVAHSLLPYTGKWYERPVPSLKNNLGWASAGAVLATDLAIAGKTGVTNALEGDTGMWRMAGSDRWNLDPSLFDKTAVLRVGFKRYPVCWHLQEYLKTLSDLLEMMAPGDEVIELVLSGPPAIERFCQLEVLSPTDIAFSLPAAFSLLISGVEPGALWAAFSEGDPVLRYRDIFRFELSDERALTLRTKGGSELKLEVTPSDHSDLAVGGLDEHGVIAKSQRLTAPELHTATLEALEDGESASGGNPDRIYSAFLATIARPPNPHSD